MNVYLCGPINGCSDADCIDWRETVKHYFPNAIDPMRRDYRGREASEYRQIVELDKRDVLNADAVLVNFLWPSVGTSMEILYAWENKIPVVVWVNDSGPISPWLRYHATALENTLEAAIRQVEEILR